MVKLKMKKKKKENNKNNYQKIIINNIYILNRKKSIPNDRHFVIILDY